MLSCLGKPGTSGWVFLGKNRLSPRREPRTRSQTGACTCPTSTVPFRHACSAAGHMLGQEQRTQPLIYHRSGCTCTKALELSLTHQRARDVSQHQVFTQLLRQVSQLCWCPPLFSASSGMCTQTATAHRLVQTDPLPVCTSAKQTSAPSSGGKPRCGSTDTPRTLLQGTATSPLSPRSLPGVSPGADGALSPWHLPSAPTPWVCISQRI